MRRALPLLLLLFVTPLCGCSFSYEFVVLNESDEALEVRYTLKERESDYYDPPSKRTLRQFRDKDEAGWRKLSGGEYSYDAAARAVTVGLGPKEALLVVRMADATADSPDAEEFFPVERIRVGGGRGSIEYGGRAARTQFVKLDGRQAFAVTYR